MINFCNYQERCSSEIRFKLKELDPEGMYHDQIQIRLSDGSYYDDERYCRSFVSGKFRIKSWGKFKIKAALLSKNIPEELINRGLKEIDHEDYRSKIESILERKFKLELVDYKMKQKILRYMNQKGYESSLVLDVLSEHEKI